MTNHRIGLPATEATTTSIMAYCVGSSAGLMAMLIVLGVMSVTWMAVIAAIAFAQKLLPARAAIDVPLAIAIVGLGTVVLVAPSSVPGLVPTASHMPMM